MSTMNPIGRVCVFAGSSPGVRPAYLDLARQLGRVLGEQKIGLVYGGASVGLMGAVADAAMAAGSEAIGVIPRGLATKEVAHHGLTALHVVDSMHERKKRMSDLADAFIALPGGLGTLKELAEIATWSMLGIHAKPLALLDVEDYWRGFDAFLDHATSEGFIRDEHRGAVMRETDPRALLDRLRAWAPPSRTRWLDRDET